MDFRVVCNSKSAEFCRSVKERSFFKGSAYIMTSAIDGKLTQYDIEITQINKGSSDGTKSFNIKIVDKRLLSVTGGIVQGMSGSPIIQDGKFAGAVTHVMINDPQIGYGIFAMSMIDTMYNSMTSDMHENAGIIKEAA